ncbi:uncharacterized protein [Argopecten irradians]|uniref:uncharacterized protein n=1 Tax=Argopecten irradians TaxID=31199 RepID=UPI00371C7719
MAAAIIKTAGDQITCTICLEIFEEPKALPCLHTFCRKCIDKYIAEKYSRNRRGRGYKCPICRRNVSVPEHLKHEPEVWAEELENNHVVTSMIDAYRTPIETQKERCTDHPEKDLDLFCVDHSKLMCSLCSKQHRHCSDVITRDEARATGLIASSKSPKNSIERDMGNLFEQCNVIENAVDKHHDALRFLDKSEHQLRKEIKAMQTKLSEIIIKNSVSKDHSSLERSEDTNDVDNEHNIAEQQIILPYQGKPSWITGMAVLPSGKLLIVDYSNEAVLAFSQSLNFLCKTDIHPAPYDIAMFTSIDDHVMMTIPDKQELMTCRVHENGFVEVGRQLKTNIVCKAVASDENYVAICSNTELQIFETDGNLWMLILDESYESTNFTYVTMTSSEHKVFITDQTHPEHHVKCLDFDGETLWQFADFRLKFCTGICVTGTQVLVTSWDSKIFFTLSFSGNNLNSYGRTTVTYPWKLHASSSKNIICISQYKTAISEEDKRTIKIFKMS